MMPAIKKSFDLTRDIIVVLSTQNKVLTKKIGSIDKKLLEKALTKL